MSNQDSPPKLLDDTKAYGYSKQFDDDTLGRLITAFRNTFLDNAESEGVLITLLELMHFFDDDIQTDEERILSNMAKKILMYCGIWYKPNGMSLIRGLKQEDRFVWLRNTSVWMPPKDEDEE